jgi:hypothetical protein
LLSSVPIVLHAARGAVPPVTAALKRRTLFTFPRTFRRTEPEPNVPRGRVTAIASRPRLAAPLTATAAGACTSLTLAFFGTLAIATATWPSAGTGTLTVAAWVVAAHSSATRSVMGRRRTSMPATVRPGRPLPHRGSP